VWSLVCSDAVVYSAVSVIDDERTSARARSESVDTQQTGERRREDQRSRLLEAIVEVVAEAGYPGARIGDISARAGVSRATFYQLFENKEACFLAAHRKLVERLTADTASAIAGGDPARAIDELFGALIDYARREPLAYGFLTHESMLAGPSSLEQRDRLMSQLAEQVDQVQRSVAGKTQLPELPTSILLGGLVRVLGMHMRRGHYDSAELLAELLKWVECYRVADAGLGAGRAAIRQAAPSGRRAVVGGLAPAPLPRGRHRLPPALVGRVQRERILHATADVIYAKGYEDATVADIVASAGVSREVFYSHFHSRSDAFTATHKLVFEQMMATAAGAFIASSAQWPERVWDSWSAATTFVVGTPSLAHFAFVESYALGPSIARRTDEAVIAFTVFLRDGHRYVPDGAEPPASLTSAIAGAVMETTSFYIRRARAAELFSVLPLMVYMILTPFVGARAARDFVERKLREDGTGDG
jgi:AcrR family transcriptional regulator